MNLLFLSSVFPDASQPTLGAYNAALCRALAESHDVQAVSPRTWRESWTRRLRGRDWQTTAADRSAGIRGHFPCLYYLPRFQPHRLGDWMWRSVRPLIRRIAREGAPDAVLSYWVHPDGDAALRAAQFLGVPSAVIVGGSDVLLLPHNARRGREIGRVLRETDLVLTVSEGLRRAVMELDIDPAKVHTVYQGVDGSVFHSGSQANARHALSLPADAEILLWVGRMVEVKRLDVLIEACRPVTAARSNVLLCLVGSGSLVKECRQRVREAGIERNVRFVGNVAPDALGEWYRAADLTVLSSDSEGLPNVLRESLACGTPYVTTDVGDIREIDGGRCGTFVAKGDANQLGEAICAALDDGERLRVDDQGARKWGDMADEVVSLITSARGFKAPHPGPLPHIDASSEFFAHRGGKGEETLSVALHKATSTVR